MSWKWVSVVQERDEGADISVGTSVAVIGRV